MQEDGYEFHREASLMETGGEASAAFSNWSVAERWFQHMFRYALFLYAHQYPTRLEVAFTLNNNSKRPPRREFSARCIERS
jgi:hypothetical protein